MLKFGLELGLEHIGIQIVCVGASAKIYTCFEPKTAFMMQADNIWYDNTLSDFFFQ